MAKRTATVAYEDPRHDKKEAAYFAKVRRALDDMGAPNSGELVHNSGVYLTGVYRAGVEPLDAAAVVWHRHCDKTGQSTTPCVAEGAAEAGHPLLPRMAVYLSKQSPTDYQVTVKLQTTYNGPWMLVPHFTAVGITSAAKARELARSIAKSAAHQYHVKPEQVEMVNGAPPGAEESPCEETAAACPPGAPAKPEAVVVVASERKELKRVGVATTKWNHGIRQVYGIFEKPRWDDQSDTPHAGYAMRYEGFEKEDGWKTGLPSAGPNAWWAQPYMDFNQLEWNRTGGEVQFFERSEARDSAPSGAAASKRELHFAGYTFDADNKGTTVRREYVVRKAGDYGADPIGDGTFRMVPSGDIVSWEERNRRLGKASEGAAEVPVATIVRNEEALASSKASSPEPIESDRDAYLLLRDKMSGEAQEIFVVLCIDLNRQLQYYVEIARGQRDRVVVEPTDIMRAVITSNCHGFIVAHNHPSGEAKPSDADIELTDRIRGAASGFSAVFMDHIVVGDGQWYSFTDKKLKKI